jgi:uncharacterized tellurite resistance protein B-like protein
MPEQAMGFASHSPAQAASAVTAFGVADSVGAVAEAHLGYARSLLQSIPESLKYQLRQVDSARWVVLALAISVSKSSREELVAGLSLSSLEKDNLLQLVEQIRALGTRLRLPLADLAIPTLQQLSSEQREALLEELNSLVQHDRRLTLFEFVLTRILANHLRAKAGRSLSIRFRRYDAVATQIQLILSLMVHASGAKGEQAQQLFKSAAGTLLPAGRTLLTGKQCRIEALDQALNDLRDLTPLLKGPLLDGLADVARADGLIQVQEAELLRGIASLMDCPMPPLLQSTNKVA